MSNDEEHQTNQEWQPLRRSGARSEAPQENGRDAQSVEPATGETPDPMLTKVANLLDDVTEGGRPPLATSGTTSFPTERGGTAADPAGQSPDPTSEPQVEGVDGPEPAVNSEVKPEEGSADGIANGFVAPSIEYDAPAVSGEPADSSGSGDVADVSNGPNRLDRQRDDLSQASNEAENSISIKGRGESVEIAIGRGNWATLVAQLNTRLEQAANFFRGGNVTLDLGDHHLTETQVDSLRSQLGKYGLNLGAMRTTSERTFEAAVSLGLSATFDGHGIENRLEAMTSDSNQALQSYFIFRGNLRSGQILHKTESVILIGDVNPGGQVISAGDVVVWGRLRGVVHAGAQGRSDAIVSALWMEPTQLRIASYIAISDESSSRSHSQRDQDGPPLAETAYIIDGTLVVRPWHESRRGFRSVLLP